MGVCSREAELSVWSDLQISAMRWPKSREIPFCTCKWCIKDYNTHIIYFGGADWAKWQDCKIGLSKGFWKVKGINHIYFVTSLLFRLCYVMALCIQSNYGSITKLWLIDIIHIPFERPLFFPYLFTKPLNYSFMCTKFINNTIIHMLDENRRQNVGLDYLGTNLFPSRLLLRNNYAWLIPLKVKRECKAPPTKPNRSLASCH